MSNQINQENEELPGKFVRNPEAWCRIIYKHEYSLNPEEQTAAKEIDKLKQQAATKESELLQLIKKSLESSLPKIFKVEKMTRKSVWSLDFEANCYGLNVEALEPTLEKKTEQKPMEPECPYKALARHHELKSILNSGVLEKWEKRKVLNLPEINNKGA